MDTKMQMFLQTSRWERLFPKFYQKHIDPKVTTMLSQGKYRMGLAEVIDNEEYAFEPPREVSIPKDNGGTRQIFVMSPLDRCTMAVIADVYTELYQKWIHPNCVSYQKGISVGATLHKLMPRLKEGGYKVDLSKYFDSVPRQVLERLLESMNTGSPLDSLLAQFYHDDRIQRNGKIVEHYKSLAQGCAFSPLLANLCLRELDAELSNLCSVYLRYCDDILILGSNADEGLEKLKEELQELGLSLNTKKVEKLEEGSVFTFLGGKICKEWVHLSDRSMKKQKKAIKNICTSAGKGAKAQRKAVRRIRDCFFKVSREGFCVSEYLFSVCTDESDIRILDEYAKDQIRSVLTGKHNHTTNRNKTSNERLQELGWVSLVSAYNEHHFNIKVFKARIAAINNRSFFRKAASQERCCRPELQERLEELWPLARLSERKTIFNTAPKKDTIYSWNELREIEDALSEMETLILTSEWVWNGQYFWQSEVWEDLVLFREWFGENPA